MSVKCVNVPAPGENSGRPRPVRTREFAVDKKLKISISPKWGKWDVGILNICFRYGKSITTIS